MAETDTKPAGIKDKFKAFTKKHENIWQFIKFALMSSIAAVVEISSLFICSKLIFKSLDNRAVDWWIFHYDPDTTGGLGSMISFFISTTLAQIVAFITNRKKTFYANNNIVFSAIVYTLMMATIICLQTWSGPILQQKFDAVIHDQNVSLLLAKLLWMFMSFLFIFPMNKYIIMRKKPERTAKTAE
jgi:putative flippase GtrA